MKISHLIHRTVSTFEEVIVGGGILVLSVSIILNVIARTTNFVLIGAEEVAQFAIVWVTFIGVSLCARKGIHITMSAIIDKISDEKKRKVLAIVIFGITAIFCLILAVLSVQLTYAVYSRGQVSPALRMPVWYYYIATAIGFSLSSIHFFRVFLKNITQSGVHHGIE
jgi:C4-dicarboxylate transporter DctQ subunit